MLQVSGLVDLGGVNDGGFFLAVFFDERGFPVDCGFCVDGDSPEGDCALCVDCGGRGGPGEHGDAAVDSGPGGASATLSFLASN